MTDVLGEIGAPAGHRPSRARSTTGDYRQLDPRRRPPEDAKRESPSRQWVPGSRRPFESAVPCINAPPARKSRRILKTRGDNGHKLPRRIDPACARTRSRRPCTAFHRLCADFQKRAATALHADLRAAERARFAATHGRRNLRGCTSDWAARKQHRCASSPKCDTAQVGRSAPTAQTLHMPPYTGVPLGPSCARLATIGSDFGRCWRRLWLEFDRPWLECGRL